MHPDPDFKEPTPHDNPRSFWEKIGGGSLSISLLFHAALVVIGVFWVLQILPPPEKKVDFMPPSGGGGTTASEAITKKHQVRMLKPDAARVAAAGVTSKLVLPEPDRLSEMTAMNSLSAGGSLSKGLGGDGSGGGKGSGSGTGFGNGMGAGVGTGGGNKNPFGMLSSGDGGTLVDTLYDFKQNAKGEPTEMTNAQFRTEINKIVRGGLKEQSFRRYFQAPRMLYQTKFHIPLMNADAAPAAFEVQDQVKPRRWAIVYRGAVKPSQGGKFRFVGAGDDFLLVRLNGKLVFD